MFFFFQVLWHQKKLQKQKLLQAVMDFLSVAVPHMVSFTYKILINTIKKEKQNKQEQKTDHRNYISNS